MFFKVWEINQGWWRLCPFELRPRRIAAVGVATRVADERGPWRAHQSETPTVVNHVNIELTVPSCPGHLLQRKSARLKNRHSISVTFSDYQCIFIQLQPETQSGVPGVLVQCFEGTDWDQNRRRRCGRPCGLCCATGCQSHEADTSAVFQIWWTKFEIIHICTPCYTIIMLYHVFWWTLTEHWWHWRSLPAFQQANHGKSNAKSPRVFALYIFFCVWSLHWRCFGWI